MQNLLARAWMNYQTWALDPQVATFLMDGVEFSGPLALSGKTGDKAGFNTELRGRCLVVPVRGVIARYNPWFARFIGVNGTTVESLAKAITDAANNSQVKTIVLDIDSPGGQLNGINELANMIYQIRTQGKKRVVAYVGGDGLSGAYWLASACSEIVIDATARLGSIGVMSCIEFPKKENSIQVVSSQSPNKALHPSSSQWKESTQQQVDQLAAVFIGQVAKFRGVAKSTVESSFGKGGVILGKAAVRARMANRLGGFEDVIKRENAKW